MDSQYIIRTELKGINQVVADFKRVQSEALRTSKAMREGARAEERAKRESIRQMEREDRARMQAARQREREASREAQRAVKESERAHRNMIRAREQLYREDLKAHQRYINQLRKQQSELEEKRGGEFGYKRQALVGAAGLGATALGVRTAAQFEASITELRLAIARAKDGAVDLELLNSQMADLEKLAVKLGNTLPGTTEDFVRLFISLKQGGMATQDILGGAGEAIANLAVLTHSDPAVLGKQFAQIGQMFKLKPEEYTAAVEQFHALYRMGVDPSELIESSKFFAPRAGAPLGMTGIEGMTQAGTLLGALNRAGLGGGIGGRNVSMMMTRLTMDTKPQQKMLAELRSKGINLDFFDKKGQFLGVDNAVMQLEKLKKLSQEDRTRATRALFTEEGATAASNILELGVEGLKAYREEAEGVIPVQQAITDLQKNFAEKWEAMMGTGSNVVVRVFTPMMNTLKPMVDGANSALAAFEELAKTHPGLAKVLTSAVGIGSVLLVVKGSVGSLVVSYRLWQLAARLAAAENVTLARSTTSVGTAATTTAAQVDTAAAKTSRWRTQLSGIPAMIGTTIVLTIASEVIAYIMKLKAEADAAWQQAHEAAAGTKSVIEKLYAGPATDDQLLSYGRTGGVTGAANFIDELKTDAKGPLGFRGLGQVLGYGFNRKNIASMIGNSMPELSMPSQFAFFMRALNANKNITESQRREIMEGAAQRFPKSFEAYTEALKRTANDRDAAEKLLLEADRKYKDAVFTSSGLIEGTFNPAIQSAAERLNTLGLTKTEGGPERPVGVPLKGDGGYVRKSGFAYIHRGENIQPADVTDRYDRTFSSTKAITVAPVFQVDARGATDPAAIEAAVERAAIRGTGTIKQTVLDVLNDEFRDRALGF